MVTRTWPHIQPYQNVNTYTRTDTVGTLVHVNASGAANLSHGNLRTTNDNPNWEVKIHNEQDAGSAYKTRQIYNRAPNYYIENRGVPDAMQRHIFRSQGTFRPYVDVGRFLNVDVDDVATRDLALKRLKQKLSDRSKQSNLLIPLVELREMRDMLRALALSATDLIRALIQIKKSKGASAFQFASHAWLTWSFGVSPTLDEIKSINESIQRFLDDQDAKFTDYGAARKVWKSSQSENVPSAFGTTCTSKTDLYHTLTYRYTCGYHPKVRSANDYGYGSHFGLEFGAMVPALWELTPFSWLFDYFGTMGDYLEDTFVSDAVNTIYVNLGRKYQVEGLTSVAVSGTSITKELHFVSKPGKYQLRCFDRSIYSQLPTRTFRLKSTDEVAKNAVNKLLNLSSILVGSKGKHYRPL